MALFRVDFSGRGELSERQQKVGIYVTLCHIGINLKMPPACTGSVFSFCFDCNRLLMFSDALEID